MSGGFQHGQPDGTQPDRIAVTHRRERVLGLGPGAEALGPVAPFDPAPFDPALFAPALFDAVDVIRGKRDGGELSDEAIDWVVEAYTRGQPPPDSYQHNLIAQAINEHFYDLGEDHPVSYQDLPNLS